jgi:hypothetical protein
MNADLKQITKDTKVAQWDGASKYLLFNREPCETVTNRSVEIDVTDQRAGLR